MRRSVFRRTATGLALFPFLAVLICTMGSLIVLLVLVLQQSRAQASVAAEADRAASGERRQQDDEAAKERREKLAEHQWRAEVLEEQRKQQAEDLAKTRLELSHLEDHIRRLEDNAKRLRGELASDRSEATDEQAQRLREELAKLEEQTAAARQKLEESRLAASKKNKSFTIIPYEGRNGTRRRPIYIECAEEGIILHPENIVFQPGDFNGPLGPGNPLDAALRTVREYLARYSTPEQSGEPYPLLIVRPNGAVAYSMARAAMKSWDDEFGYELIDGETDLKFPPSDPQLEELLLRSIRDARQRQVALAAAMPSRYKGNGSPTTEETVPAQSFASPAAGRSAASGRGVGGSGASGGLGNGAGGTGTGGGTGSAAVAGSSRTPGGIGGRGGTGSGGPGTGGSGPGGSGPGGSGAGGAGGSGDGTDQGEGEGSTTGGGGFGAGRGAGGAGFAGGGTGGEGGVAGASGGGAGGGAGAGGAAGGGFAMPGGIGGGSAGPGMPSASFGASPASVAQTGGASGSTGASGGSSSSSGASRGGGSSRAGSATSLAGNGSPSKFSWNGDGKEGKEGDWALPAKPQAATAITRPIRVRCEAHRLVIYPERGDGQQPKVIELKGSVGNSLQDVIGIVRRRIDGWGLAVRGGYWKPVLNITVAPGADEQYAELERLLQGSGIDVVRK